MRARALFARLPFLALAAGAGLALFGAGRASVHAGEPPRPAPTSRINWDVFDLPDGPKAITTGTARLAQAATAPELVKAMQATQAAPLKAQHDIAMNVIQNLPARVAGKSAAPIPTRISAVGPAGFETLAQTSAPSGGAEDPWAAEAYLELTVRAGNLALTMRSPLSGVAPAPAPGR
ncbi:MAG: hypothetical protein IT460_15350 [Planctomycetes bacterium]|nr:hypothetical protein [Planctomycetota bacterium]